MNGAIYLKDFDARSHWPQLRNPSMEGDHMATAAERMRAHRDRARRGLRRLTIDVNEGDLQAIAMSPRTRL